MRHNSREDAVSGGAVDIEAFVVVGRGLASNRRARDVEELSQIISRSLVRGSLNVVGKKPLWLDTRRSTYLNAADGHFYWEGLLNGMPVIVNRWVSCPAHAYEIFAEENLRDKLCLKDLDAVRLTLPKAIVDWRTSLSVKSRLMWFLVWRGREKYAYGDGYKRILEWKGLRSWIWRSWQSAS